mmetsp:Transcript_9374/g.15925  ORF Transcript_9374/g.15925 Transcript_9374/m.15925 type:complete len:344 (-) Transcript_9374:43-1074(-)
MFKNLITLSIFMCVILALFSGVHCVCKDTCVLDPEVTEGPYYVDLQLVRSDIREDKSGIPLYLNITVINSNNCEVLPNAGVEIWHCDAVGIYSHFEEASENVQNPQTDDTTYLRGIQVADSTGSVEFTTIYPGWYQGRALHIHLKVHQGSTTGAVLHTGQLFFEEEVNEMVEVLSPYSSHDVTRLTNDEDGIYNQGGYYGLISNWSLVGSDISEGIMASISVEVDGPETYYDEDYDEYDEEEYNEDYEEEDYDEYDEEEYYEDYDEEDADYDEEEEDSYSYYLYNYLTYSYDSYSVEYEQTYSEYYSTEVSSVDYSTYPSSESSDSSNIIVNGIVLLFAAVLL